MNKEVSVNEITYKAIRSSGAGGQNVNKVSSKVVLFFDIANTNALSEDEKTLIESKLQSKINQDKILSLNCDEDRSQLKNKEIVTKRFFEMIEKALIIPNPRKATKIPKEVNEKRIKEKKNTSEIKQNRKKLDF